MKSGLVVSLQLLLFHLDVMITPACHSNATHSTQPHICGTTDLPWIWSTRKCFRVVGRLLRVVVLRVGHDQFDSDCRSRHSPIEVGRQNPLGFLLAAPRLSQPYGSGNRCQSNRGDEATHSAPCVANHGKRPSFWNFLAVFRSTSASWHALLKLSDESFLNSGLIRSNVARSLSERNRISWLKSTRNVPSSKVTQPPKRDSWS